MFRTHFYHYCFVSVKSSCFHFASSYVAHIFFHFISNYWCFFLSTLDCDQVFLEVLKSGFFTFPSLQILSNVLLATSSCDSVLSLFPVILLSCFSVKLYSGILFLFKALSKSLTVVGHHPFLFCFEISAGTISAVFQASECGGEPEARFSLCIIATEIPILTIVVLRRKS